MKRLLPAFACVALATAAVAEVRVYQPETQTSAPKTSHETVAPSPTLESVSSAEQAKAEELQQNINETWEKLVNRYTGSNTDPELIVYLKTGDYSDYQNDAIERLLEMKELQQMGLYPAFYINDIGFSNYSAAFAESLGKIEKEIELTLDSDDTIANAYGIGNRSTIVYRDPTGAVRLYNLTYEVDKLQRQLARQQLEAQSQ